VNGSEDAAGTPESEVPATETPESEPPEPEAPDSELPAAEEEATFQLPPPDAEVQ